MKLLRLLNIIVVSLALLPATFAAHAQFAGTGARDNFRDTTILRPPAGVKVALIVFEDLGCPACARAHPFEVEAVKQTHVALLRYDFPIEAHVWTFSGAVCARYVQDTYGPAMAEEFRSAVFKTQNMYSSEEDIHRFLATFLERRGKKMPAVFDPGGKLGKEVTADYELGKRLNVEFTPTVVIVTRNNYQVVCGTKEGANDPAKILEVVKAAMAQAH
jgi:protein-disulfide isomerase